MRDSKNLPRQVHNLMPDSSSSSRGWPSSSVIAWRQSVGFLVRQARSPSLHFAVCISPRRCPFPSETREGHVFLTRVQQFFLAWGSQQSGSIHESQRTRKRIGRSISRQVPKLHNSASACPGVCFCKHVKRLGSLAPRLPGVLRRSSWWVSFLAFSRISLKSARAANRKTFDVVTPNCRFLYNDSHCNVVTRYGPFSKVVRNVGIAVDIRRLCHWEINKCFVNSG